MALRVGFIGYGGVARSHVNDFEFFREDNELRQPEDPLCEIVALADPSEEARANFRERTGVAALYSDYEQMLDREQLDLVTITTRADVRVGPVTAAAARGVHVLCEKPMACDVAECDQMVEVCQRAGVQLVISHQRRSDPYHWQARRMLDEGLIGRLRLVRGSCKSVRAGPQLHNIGSHLFDAVGIFAGPAQWVHGYCTIEGRECTREDAEPGDRGAGLVLGEYISVQVGYESGAQLELQVGEHPGVFGWELIGDQGRLALYHPQQQIYHYPHETWAPDSNPGDWRPVERRREPITTDSGWVIGDDWVDLEAQVGRFTRVFMLREMFHRMAHGGEHTSSGRVGRRAQELIQATFVSHLAKARAYLPLPERRSPLL